MKSEPALILGVLNAVVALVTSTGFHLSPEWTGAITAGSAIIAAILTRSQVSPAH